MSRESATSRHWRKSLADDGVCWLTLDKADAAANTLSSDVLEELSRALDGLQSSSLRGVVFESGKRSGFILGADVKEFATCL